MRSAEAVGKVKLRKKRGGIDLFCMIDLKRISKIFAGLGGLPRNWEKISMLVKDIAL